MGGGLRGHAPASRKMVTKCGMLCMRQPFSSQGSGGVVLPGGCVTWQRSCPCGQGAVWLLACYGMATALVQGLSAPPRVLSGLLVNVRVAQLGHAD